MFSLNCIYFILKDLYFERKGVFHIVFCADEKYIKFAAAMMRNIILKTNTQHTFKDFFKEKELLFLHPQKSSYPKLSYESLSQIEQKEGYVFHILTKNITLKSKEKLTKLCDELSLIYPCLFEVHEIDDTKYKNTYAYKGSFVANFLLEFANFVPLDSKKVLALDLDMYVNTDLRELFTLDLKDFVLAAAFNYTLKSKWFNTGFILFNAVLWRELDMQQKCLDYICEFKPELPDQAALNICCKDRTLLLPLLYNFYPHNENQSKDFFKDESKFHSSELTRAEWEHLKQNAKIIHFLGCSKPWEGVFSKKKDIFISHFRKKWWQNALHTPFFAEELRNLAFLLQEEELWNLFLYFEESFKKLNESSKLLSADKKGAVIRFKNELEYKIGQEMMGVKLHFLSYISFVFKARKLIKKHKKIQKAYEELIGFNPDLALPKLETYADYTQAMALKRHLTYRLGKAFMKAYQSPFKLGMFGLLGEIEKLKKEF
ncbi:hypothetical protein DMB95_01965 [Campylobacter sp. MIT 12-8780]|nr:hypothetical protein DMB95_01965 [Campylobacter sp. MIT 12-8780]